MLTEGHEGMEVRDGDSAGCDRVLGKMSVGLATGVTDLSVESRSYLIITQIQGGEKKRGREGER